MNVRAAFRVRVRPRSGQSLGFRRRLGVGFRVRVRPRFRAKVRV